MDALGKLFLSLVLVAVATDISSAQVTTVSWSAQNPGSGLAGSDGRELSAGNLVRLGCFDLSPEAVVENSGNLSVLEANFREISRARIGTFGSVTMRPVISGAFSQLVSVDPLEVDRDLVGCRAYIWVFNAARLDDATEHGIFSSRKWIFPSDRFSVPQWGIEEVEPGSTDDVYIGEQSTSESPTVKGRLNRLVALNETATSVRQRLLQRAFGENLGHREFVTPGRVEGTYEYRRLSHGVDLEGGGYAGGGIAYVVEVSEDLKKWQRTEIAPVSVTKVEGDLYELVAFRPILDSSDERYVRVRVTDLD